MFQQDAEPRAVFGSTGVRSNGSNTGTDALWVHVTNTSPSLRWNEVSMVI
jgi:hypothetical protein